MAAFKGLLELLGLWKWIALGGAFIVTFILTAISSLPLWAMVLLSVTCPISLLVTIIAIVALCTSGRESSASSGNGQTRFDDNKSDPIAADKKMLQSLQVVFPSSAVAGLRIQQFWTTFQWSFDAVLIAFHNWGLVPEHRFLNDDIEAIHTRLRDLAHALLDRVHRYTEKLSPTNEEARGFTPLGTITDMEEHEAHRDEVWKTKDMVCAAYDELIRTATQRFSGISAAASMIPRPRVVAVSYEVIGGKEAVRLYNEGSPAQNVGIEDLRVGAWIVRFQGSIPLLESRESAYLLVQSIRKNLSENSGESAQHLDTAWRDTLTTNGMFERVTLRIAYRNFEGQTFRAVCEIERDVLKHNPPFHIRNCRDAQAEEVHALGAHIHVL